VTNMVIRPKPLGELEGFLFDDTENGSVVWSC